MQQMTREEIEQKMDELALRVCKDWEPEQKGSPSMSLQDHSLMYHRGVPSWPPIWTWTGEGEDKSPKGEVGVLRWVSESNIQRVNKCFLFIDHEESSYGGVLKVDYHAFCTEIVRFLQEHCYHRPIAEIGGLELPPSF